MTRLSDIIESFIKDLLNESNEDQLQIQRNALADKFNCAPSQINYVLTTRFTNEKGYLIESRRGGGGYIIIKRIIYNNNERRNKLIQNSIGNSITYHNSIIILENLYENGLIDEKMFEIIKVAISDRTLQNVYDKNELRASILKAMVMVILS